MNRIFVTILLLLLLITGGVLLWQWNVYSEKGLDLNPSSYKASEIIDMAVTDKHVEIKHEISGLPAGNYQVRVPKNEEFSCQEDKTDCKLSGNQKEKLTTNGGTIHFTYKFKKTTASAYVLNKWAVELQNVNMNKTRVEITHYGKHSGIWAVGANLVGETKKNQLSYYVFEGKGGVFPLYFQKKQLKKIEEDGFTVYGDTSTTLIKAAKKYEVQTPFTIILTDQVSPFSSQHLLMGRSKVQIERALSDQYVNKNYPFKKKGEKWLQSFIRAFVLDEKTEGKPEKLSTELSKELTNEQQAAFISILKKERGHEFSAVHLDELLSDVMGLKTNYFENNKSKGRKPSTLLFINHAKWVDEKGAGSAVESVTVHTKRYYLLTQITTNLGFRYEPISDTHIYLSDGKTSFRLYPGENTFLYNEKAYSINGELLREINHKYYISEEYLRKIFNVLVREKDNELQLISLN